jgi:hypothetical protein
MGIPLLVDAGCEVIMRDADMEDNGELRNLLKFATTLRLDQVSSWQIDMHTSDFNALNAGGKSFSIGGGIMFKRDEELLMSGPVLMIKTHYVAGDRTTSIVGADDNFWLMTRICYPVVEGMIQENGAYRFGVKKAAEGLTTTVATDVVKGQPNIIVKNADGFLPGSTITVATNGGVPGGIVKIAAIDYPQNTLITNYPTLGPHPTGTLITQSGTNNAIIDDPSWVGYDTRTGNAETVMKELVVFNAGIHSCTDKFGPRAIPHLTIPSNHGRGNVVTVNSRGEFLLNQVQATGLAGVLHFQIKQVEQDLVFDVFNGDDLTLNDDLVFSVEAGNLKEYEWSIGAPIANMLIGAGPNAGPAKIMQPSADLVSINEYGRFEGWNNAYTGNAATTDSTAQIVANMDATNQLSLLTQANNSSIVLTIQETDQVRYPRDFDLGDKIRIMVDDEPTDQILTNVSYTIPAGSASGSGSASAAFSKMQMNRSMVKLNYQGDLIRQLMLNN